MIYQKLNIVQSKMKAPKNLFNSFGKYKYRNAESILEAFKPYGKELGLVLMLNDSVEKVGDRVYIKATATLIDIEDNSRVDVSAYAREPVNKKGLDDSQLSGSTSSYARKYCLNGLFLLDDTKDADTDEYRTQAENQYNAQKPQKVSDVQAKSLMNVITKKGLDADDLLSRVGADDISDLTPDKYNEIVMMLRGGK